jgi:nitrogen fixation NifU-like protein
MDAPRGGSGSSSGSSGSSGSDRPAPDLSSLYQELILKHYKHPRNRGELENADVEVFKLNVSCGDEVRLQLRVEEGVIRDARFQGQGCSISQASTSMMTELVKGRDAAESRALAERFTQMMHGDAEAARDRAMGDLRALAGVSRYPTRVKCALLAWDALDEALRRLASA